jgi:hypothetical protein
MFLSSYIFIPGLFSNAVGNSNCTASNDFTIANNHVEENGRGII